jgi:hypothetical protein
MRRASASSWRGFKGKHEGKEVGEDRALEGDFEGGEICLEKNC